MGEEGVTSEAAENGTVASDNVAEDVDVSKKKEEMGEGVKNDEKDVVEKDDAVEKMEDVKDDEKMEEDVKNEEKEAVEEHVKNGDETGTQMEEDVKNEGKKEEIEESFTELKKKEAYEQKLITYYAHCKLFRRKVNQETLHLLHDVLYGTPGKFWEVKDNISRLSNAGFVLPEKEEKLKLELKEKLDKHNKEMLLEFCQIFDMTVSRANAKKEDIVVKLIDFMLAPHHPTSEAAEKLQSFIQSYKGKKRNRPSNKSTSTPEATPSNSSSKKQKTKSTSEEDKKKAAETDNSEEESDEEEKNSSSSPQKKTQAKSPKSEKQKIRENDLILKSAICVILKQVEFKTATFTDVFKQLSTQFNTDLTPKKVIIKIMIEEVLTKLADEAIIDEEEEELKKTAKQASGNGVKA